MTTTTSNALDFYAAIGAALFPIPAGSKEPFGIVKSFATDNSTDPEQWKKWLRENPGCNFGIVAGVSWLIIIDIDVKQGREAAWQAWCELCASWGVAPVLPHVESASGGWHCYFLVPANVDPMSLRQPDAIKGLINIRAGNGYCVTAGSVVNDRPYTLFPDAPLYAAPDALVAHCTRAPRTATSAVIGSRDIGDTAALIKWLHERGQFDDYESWYQLGAALRIEFGDAGLDLWRIATWDEAADQLPAKWESFATEPTGNSVTLSTFLQRAHALGWRGQVRKATAAMFGPVEAMAQAAGATLPGASATGMPMLEGQRVLAELGGPILADFLDNTRDAPNVPAAPDYPQLPDACSGHGLYEPLRRAIARIIAMAETQKGWKAARVVRALALLKLVHVDCYGAVVRRLQHMGVTVPESKIKLEATAIEDRVQRAFVTQDAWICDTKGDIEHNNSDNVAVFLGIMGCEVRWNGWLDRAEIRGAEWREWSYIDDAIVAKLRTRGNRTKTRFLPSKEFFWESLLAKAQENWHDPAVEHIATLQSEWDQQPRLVSWLSRACGVPCDHYHQAVGRNIIGGIVRRVRHAGCKHDTMPVFYGRQGTGKSTLAAILADMGQSPFEAILKNSGEWFNDNIMLGEASKELIQLLSGVSVVEISEMGMRGNSNAAHIKAMISRQVDVGRTAYARAVTNRKRRNIFIGTTNDDEPLTDPTGNRRFLPINAAQTIDLEWLHANVRQLIGEAAALEAKGADFNLPKEVWGLAAEHQEAARSESDVETMLYEWLGSEPIGSRWSFITSFDLVQLGNLAGWKVATGALRNTVLKRLGFRKSAAYINGKKTPMWVRGPEALPAHYAAGVRYMVSQGAEGPRVTQRGGGK